MGPLPSSAQTAADAAATRLFVADGGSSTIYVISLAAPYGVKTIRSTVSAPWDMQWSAALNTLLVLGSYELYTVNPSSGSTARLINIVDGRCARLLRHPLAHRLPPCHWRLAHRAITPPDSPVPIYI